MESEGGHSLGMFNFDFFFLVGVSFFTGNSLRRTPTYRSQWRRRAQRRSVWVETMRSCFGVSRPAPWCLLRPPRCTAPSLPPPSPPLHSCPPLLWQVVSPPLTATATSPPLTELPPIRTCPLDQPHPLTGQRLIIITHLVRPHPHIGQRLIRITHLVRPHPRTGL